MRSLEDLRFVGHRQASGLNSSSHVGSMAARNRTAYDMLGLLGDQDVDDAAELPQLPAESSSRWGEQLPPASTTGVLPISVLRGPWDQNMHVIRFMNISFCSP